MKMSRISHFLAAVAMLLTVAVVSASAEPNQQWTDPKFGYTITYPSSMHMTTEGGELMRQFMMRPRFALSFAPPDSHDIGNHFMIATVSGAGHKSSAQFAQDLLQKERTQGGAIMHGLKPVRNGRHTFYTFTSMNGTTRVHHNVIVRGGKGFDFMIEDKSTRPDRQEMVLNRVLQSVDFSHAIGTGQ